MALRGCCCCGLRGGAKSVGVLFLIVTLMGLLGVIVTWCMWGSYGMSAFESQIDGQLRWAKALSPFNTGLEGLVDNSGRRLTPLICSTVYVVLAVIFNSMLVHGTNHDSTRAVLAWLVFYGAVFVCASLGCVVGLVYAGILLSSASSNSIRIGTIRIGTGVHASVGTGAVIGAVCGLLVCALLWFWWRVVLDFYRQLDEATKGAKYQRDVSLQAPMSPLAVRETNGEARA